MRYYVRLRSGVFDSALQDASALATLAAAASSRLERSLTRLAKRPHRLSERALSGLGRRSGDLYRSNKQLAQLVRLLERERMREIACEGRK